MEGESIYKILDKFVAEEEEAQRLQQAKALTSKTHKIALLRNDPAPKSTILAEHHQLLSRDNLLSSFSVNRKQHATFGLPEGQSKPQPLTRKLPVTSPSATVPGLSGEATFHPKVHTKPTVPLRSDAPIQGLSSNADFILKNQVWATTIKPPKAPETMDYTKKATFGRIPDYLDKIKMTIDKENEFLRSLQDRRTIKPEPTLELPADQIHLIRDRLQQKHQDLTHSYQRLTHVTKDNTIGFLRRKEGLEKALDGVERDLNCLQKSRILIVK
jgi:hypothetical protein